jgi:hypothetical protein
MNNLHNSTELYDVSTYTDKELYDILDLNIENNVSDHVLEAKILSMVKKYDTMSGETAELLTQFFIDIYARFFEISSDTGSDTETEYETEDDTEGFTSGKYAGNKSGELIENVKEYDIGNTFTSNTSFSNYEGIPADVKSPKITQVFNVNEVKNRGVLDITANERNTDNAQLTKPVDYKKDTLNPLLKQTVKRVISIDSQYRENKNKSSTEFTFNLSEPLKDVVSLKLYSIQIPYTWYTISSNFGGNFFYIKGNAPGIDNGDHDYKIEIRSGNYTSKELIETVKTSIHNLKTNTPDVSFGTMDITYDSNNVLTTINIDIKEVFGETNYYVKFPDVKSDKRIKSLRDFLGYNDRIYDVCSVRSGVITNIDSRDEFTVTDSVIQIDTYTVSDTKTMGYDGLDASYNKIYISVPDGSYSIQMLVENINASLQNNPALDKTHSFMQIRKNDISDISGYIVLNIKPTRAFLQNIENIKTVVIFPDNSYIWDGSGSKLKFPAKINELSNVISENTTFKSRYIIDLSSDYIDISSNNPYYTQSYKIDIPKSPDVGYKLDDYKDVINQSINTYPDLSGTSMHYTDGSYVHFDVSVNKIYTQNDYYIRFNGNKIAELFDQSANKNIDLSGQNVFSSRDDYDYSNLNIKDEKIQIRLKHNEDVSLSIVFTKGYSGFNDFINDLSNSFTDISDVCNLNNLKPLKKSTITGSSIGSITMTINIDNSLRTSDYTLKLNSKNNNWVNYLDFNTGIQKNDYYVSTYSLKETSDISNNSVIYDNLIELDASNNYFELIPFSDINGLNTLKNYYTIRIGLSYNIGETYAMDEIYDKINEVFNTYPVLNDVSNKNPLLKGSYIRNNVPTTNTGNSIMRLNINKTFTSPDYKLVFYDPASFITCYTGVSNTGNKYVQNTTWDTTLGWILGFREKIIYYLNEYIGENTNNCVFVGDTTVSTSLYNYFLIVLDDYTQNHLNDGLVTITPQETSIDVEPYTYMCDPYGTSQIAVPLSAIDQNGRITETQRNLYTFNEKLLSNQVKEKSYSKGPFVKDIFGIIPIKTSTLNPGTVYVETAGTLQDQERLYFGPVNIHRMTIRLLNDRGDLVDLNNQNWSFSLVCEQLYRSNL